MVQGKILPCVRGSLRCCPLSQTGHGLHIAPLSKVFRETGKQDGLPIGQGSGLRGQRHTISCRQAYEGRACLGVIQPMKNVPSLRLCILRAPCPLRTYMTSRSGSS